MTRRAFTLLETLLAASIGSVIVLAVLSIVWLVQTTDRRLNHRYEQMGDLRAARLVMSRTFTRLLVSSQPPPAMAPGEGTGQRWADIKRKRDTDPDAFGPDRISLTPDPSLASMVMERAGPDARRITPQRLEVVLTDPPVPSPRAKAASDAAVAAILTADASRRSGAQRRPESESRRDRASGATGEGERGPGARGSGARAAGAQAPRTPPREAKGGDRAGPARDAAADTAPPEETDMAVRSVRGAFELRPDPLARPGEPSWELWWVSLPRLGQAPGEVELAPVLDEPFRVASHIRYLSWRFYRDRDWMHEVHAAISDELPAYVEVEIETTAGLRDKWLFEISFARGPELRRRSVGGPNDASSPGSGPDRSGSGASSSEKKK